MPSDHGRAGAFASCLGALQQLQVGGSLERGHRGVLQWGGNRHLKIWQVCSCLKVIEAGPPSVPGIDSTSLLIALLQALHPHWSPLRESALEQGRELVDLTSHEF